MPSIIYPLLFGAVFCGAIDIASLGIIAAFHRKENKQFIHVSTVTVFIIYTVTVLAATYLKQLNIFILFGAYFIILALLLIIFFIVKRRNRHKKT